MKVVLPAAKFRPCFDFEKQIPVSSQRYSNRSLRKGYCSETKIAQTVARQLLNPALWKERAHLSARPGPRMIPVQLLRPIFQSLTPPAHSHKALAALPETALSFASETNATGHAL